jgi:hypothetical protein
MVKISEAFPSKYSRPCDVDPPIVATIKVVAQETIKGLDGKEQEKTVLYFSKGLKPLPLNKTNFEAVTDISGADDSEQFPGTKIELYKTRVQGPHGMTDGIRIRSPGAGKAKPKKAASDGDGEKPPYNDEVKF